jgi:hypothetical protein
MNGPSAISKTRAEGCAYRFGGPRAVCVEVELGAVAPCVASQDRGALEGDLSPERGARGFEELLEDPEHREDRRSRVDFDVAYAQNARLSAGVRRSLEELDPEALHGELDGACESAHAGADDDCRWLTLWHSRTLHPTPSRM